MQIKNFHIERYFAQYEFSTRYLLCCSDCDGFKISDVLSLATDAEKAAWEQL
jgi:hypothetical protein